MKNNRIYENQHKTADKIINSIKLGHRRIHVLAPTQAGKTGVIVSLANKMKDNNFILTSGMMDNHLYDQNSNIAETSAPNIIAIKINKLLEEPNPKSIIKRLDIKVIVVDENNYGIGKKSRIDKFIKKLLSMELSVKIIWLGATGYQLVNSDLIDDTIQMNVPSNYFGCNQILKLPNLKDSKGFKFTIDADSKLRKKVGIDYGFSLSNEFLNELDYLKSFETGMGIIRVSKIEMAKNLKVAIGNARPFSETFVATSAGTDSIKTIVTEAKMASNTKRIVLIVVGGLKAGVDLGQAKNNIRFIIETYKTKAAVSQGLVGRISGYHENRDISIVADKSAIELQAAYENDYRCINDEFLKEMFESGTHSLATNFSFGKQKLGKRKKTFYGDNYKVKTPNDVKAEWFKNYTPDYLQKVKDLIVKIQKSGENGYNVSASDFPNKNDIINTIQSVKFKKSPKDFQNYVRRTQTDIIDFNIFHRFADTSSGKKRIEKNKSSKEEYAEKIKVGIIYNKDESYFNVVVRHTERKDRIINTRINNKSIFNNKNN